MKLSVFKTNKSIVLSLVFLTIFGATIYFNLYKNNTEIMAVSNFDNLKRYYATDIAPFDGTDDNQPIYIAMNGLVYDVSAGREFYRSDGPYHYLAGKDSSTELNMVGGAIIKRKYPVIGKFVDNDKK